MAPGQGIQQDREPCCILSPNKEHHVPRQERPWGTAEGGDGGTAYIT